MRHAEEANALIRLGQPLRSWQSSGKPLRVITSVKTRDPMTADLLRARKRTVTTAAVDP